MGIVAYAAVAIAAYSAYESHEQQVAASKDRKHAKEEQAAINAQKQADERRAQLREERVRRARVIQASTNTNVVGSSGELGAIAGLETKANAAIGVNAGLAMHGAAIGDALQSADNHMVEANMWGNIGQLAMSSASIFSGSTSKTPNVEPGKVVATPTPQPVYKGNFDSNIG